MPGLRSPHGGLARPRGVDAFPRQHLRWVARAARIADLVKGIRTSDQGRSDSETGEGGLVADALAFAMLRRTD